MNKEVDIHDVLYSNICLADEEFEHRLTFLSDIYKFFDMKFIIRPLHLKDVYDKHMSGLFFTSLDQMNDVIKIDSLIGNRLKNTRKLLVIDDLNTINHDSRVLQLLLHGVKFNCTIVFVNSSNSDIKKIKNFKLNIHHIIFSYLTKHQINSIRDVYFSPSYDLEKLTDAAKILNEIDGKYKIITLNSKRYLFFDDRFKYIYKGGYICMPEAKILSLIDTGRY